MKSFLNQKSIGASVSDTSPQIGKKTKQNKQKLSQVAVSCNELPGGGVYFPEADGDHRFAPGGVKGRRGRKSKYTGHGDRDSMASIWAH